MKYTNENINLENGLKKEWLITNGIGGFAASTIIGANTRKYHGLLIAPLSPPARRYLILSKVDESIQINNNKYDLYTNICNDYISHGYKYQTEFSKDYIPTFKYKVEDVEITKKICMEYGKNTVGIYYKIKNGKNESKLTLAPVMNYRDFHKMNTDYHFHVRQEIKNNKVKVVIDNQSYMPIYMKALEGNYIKHDNDDFKNMFYLKEQERGFYPEENHVVPGIYEIQINPNEEKEISFVCSLEENIEQIDVKELINKEILRLQEIIDNSSIIDNSISKKTKKQLEQDELLKTYLISTDNFIAYRPNFRLHTIIAGFPWFLDWGRDTLISFEGLLLITKRFEIAKEVLLTMVRDIKYGLVPNGYSGYDNRPLYNSVDASLLLFEEIYKYIKYTNDYDFVEQKMYKNLEEIIEKYCKGIDVDNNNIYLDDDGLIVSGTEETQNTWKDAKYNGIAVTPRNGKAVEINSLWYNALNIMIELSKKYNKITKIKEYKKLAKACKETFNKKFYNEKKKCLYDVIGDSKIRPNQLFSLSLTYPIVDPTSEIADNIINVVEKKLLNNYGLKTLAKGEENYIEIYEGSPEKRDRSYHQGITWVWLLGVYYDALKNQLKFAKTKTKKQEIEQKIDKLVEKTNKTFKKEMYDSACVGGISELYDSVKPQLPRGTFNQAWSVAEVFRIILRK